MNETLNLEGMMREARALADSTRLRIANLLARAQLNVTELCSIVGQSQPGISRHLKILVEAGLISRQRDGNWALYHLPPQQLRRTLAGDLIARLDPADTQIALDLARLAEVQSQRAAQAQAYFRRAAGEWDSIRRLYIDEAKVEAALQRQLPAGPLGEIVDIGTGTGRILGLLAERAERGIGIDTSREMLSVARANLERQGLRNVEVRHGDMAQLPLPSNAFDLATLHMVLHYAADPARAISEAARVLRPGGRLLIVDFAPHKEERLRAEHAHRWLGFADGAISEWLAGAHLGGTRSEQLPADPLTVIVYLATKDSVAMAQAS
ncbi:ArsR/SmtB family transcription factor [Algihabitans albus]|uniref:ArsR/SmtB family transcription factor n=1 Tax=Algihabitans albus TaxID=2164067 RepID=UPI001F3B4C2A|nr:metalloregulator ArsR/SmtB family transcription factor [Algihabitans albus]